MYFDPAPTIAAMNAATTEEEFEAAFNNNMGAYYGTTLDAEIDFIQDLPAFKTGAADILPQYCRYPQYMLRDLDLHIVFRVGSTSTWQTGGVMIDDPFRAEKRYVWHNMIHTSSAAYARATTHHELMHLFHTKWAGEFGYDPATLTNDPALVPGWTQHNPPGFTYSTTHNSTPSNDPNVVGPGFRSNYAKTKFAEDLGETHGYNMGPDYEWTVTQGILANDSGYAGKSAFLIREWMTKHWNWGLPSNFYSVSKANYDAWLANGTIQPDPSSAKTSSPPLRAWNGSQWEPGVAKVWNGTQWLVAKPKVYVAGQWVPTTTGNAAPVNQIAPSIVGTPYVGDTLTADVGTWSGTEPITYYVTWRLNTNPVHGGNVPGTGESWVVAGTPGDVIQLDVEASGPGGFGGALSPNVTILDDPQRVTPTFIGATTFDNSAGTLSSTYALTYPGGILAGDKIYVLAACESPTTQTASISGFTPVDSKLHNTQYRFVQLLQKTATGSESGTVNMTYGTALNATATMIVVRGWDANTVPDWAVESTVNNAGSSITFPALTSSIVNPLVLRLLMSAGTLTTPGVTVRSTGTAGSAIRTFAGTDDDNSLGAVTVTSTAVQAHSGYTIAIPGVYSGPAPDPTAPGAPTNLTATPQDTAVALSWTAPSNGGSAITHYEYRLSTDGGSTWSSAINTGSTTTSYTVTGLTNGTAYTFQVRAVNAIGPSTYSVSASATPTASANSFPSQPGDLEDWSAYSSALYDGPTAPPDDVVPRGVLINDQFGKPFRNPASHGDGWGRPWPAAESIIPQAGKTSAVDWQYGGRGGSWDTFRGAYTHWFQVNWASGLSSYTVSNIEVEIRRPTVCIRLSDGSWVTDSLNRSLDGGNYYYANINGDFEDGGSGEPTHGSFGYTWVNQSDGHFRSTNLSTGMSGGGTGDRATHPYWVRKAFSATPTAIVGVFWARLVGTNAHQRPFTMHCGIDDYLDTSGSFTGVTAFSLSRQKYITQHWQPFTCSTLPREPFSKSNMTTANQPYRHNTSQIDFWTETLNAAFPFSTADPGAAW